jgi:hypothetical protein
VSTILLVAVALAATIYSSLAARQEQANIRALTDRTAREQDRLQLLTKRNEDLDRKKKLVKLVVEDRPPPVPLWVFAYLGQAVPPQLVVTNLLVTRTTNDLWQLQVAGTLQDTNELSLTEASRALRKLQDELTQGPFHVKLSGDPAQTMDPANPVKPGDTNAIPRWLDQGRLEDQARQQAATQHVDHFLIEGTIR